VAAASGSIAGGWRTRDGGEPAQAAIREGAAAAARATNAALAEALASADKLRW
jgi:hypothetical protein